MRVLVEAVKFHCRWLGGLAEAVRVTEEAVRVLLEAVRMIIEALERL